jgi:DNA/RNA-binding domain of Phe-tRNA-synthetase-like protein
MKITIDQEVKTKFPELGVFYRVIQNAALNHSVRSDHNGVKLTDEEFEDYRQFRSKNSGELLLAVERLLERSKSLPEPDPLTSLIIQTSYSTRLPLTVFCSDSFSSVTIRFSRSNDVLKLNERSESIKPGLLVADTDHGIMGVFGIKSSTLGRVTSESKNLVVLSFACSERTKAKASKLVEIMADKLEARSKL